MEKDNYDSGNIPESRPACKDSRCARFRIRRREQNSRLFQSQIFFLLFLNLCALCVVVVNHLLRVLPASLSVLPGTPLADGVDYNGV
jgi:hypothetical protein